MAFQFSAQQAAFATELQRQTGLDPAVIAGWMAAEEPPGSQSGYGGTQDWLNVGITDSGPRGAGNPAWQDPVQAAALTASWMKGETQIPGFGYASSGIRAIVGTAGQPIDSQVAAIQGSGWASSGYPDLPQLVQQSGGKITGTGKYTPNYGGPGGGRTRPGGNSPGSGSGSSGGSGGVQTELDNYVALRDTPRTAPPGTSNPFKWWQASFTGNWENI